MGDRPSFCWVEVGYGQACRATCNLSRPRALRIDNTECLTQDLKAAKALAGRSRGTDTDGGWQSGAKTVRKLALLFQSSTNAVRQDFQAADQRLDGTRSVSKSSCQP